MLWVVHCLDAPDSAQPRERERAAHSARLREAVTATGGAVRPVLYGRLMNDDRTAAAGSLLVFEAEHREQVEKFVADDPFTTSGIWREVRIHPYAQSVNAPVVIPTAD